MAPLHPLRTGEEEWQPVFGRLCERFPQVAKERVADILREQEGHAGNAATILRETSSSVVKEQDPDDVEHVSTLLSSPVMFKHACKEQFAAFDRDGNGVLDVDEVISLTNNLYSNFGLQTPSEGSVRAFFVAMDQNNDGVLSEREFRRFFEMYLRFAFFDVVKLRQLVEQGNQKAGGSAMPTQASGGYPSAPPAPLLRSSPSVDSLPTTAKHQAPDSPRKPHQTEHRSRKNKDRELEDSGTGRSQHRSHRNRDRELEDGGTSRSQHRSHRNRDRELEDGGTSRSHRSQKHRSSHRHESHLPHGACGSVRCVAQNGVAYRQSVEYEDRRSDAVCHRGDRVQILEHWVRTSEGWLPMVDLQGNALFQLREDGASRRAKVRIDDPERSQSPESRLEDRNDASLSRLEESQDLDRSEAQDDDEGEWKETADRLCVRVPKVPRERILKCLRDNNGHAGVVASMCREMQG
jgi:Ca2+-binding EF-hand superfamily protein